MACARCRTWAGKDTGPLIEPIQTVMSDSETGLAVTGADATNVVLELRSALSCTPHVIVPTTPRRLIPFASYINSNDTKSKGADSSQHKTSGAAATTFDSASVRHRTFASRFKSSPIASRAQNSRRAVCRKLGCRYSGQKPLVCRPGGKIASKSVPKSPPSMLSTHPAGNCACSGEYCGMLHL